MLTKVGLSNRLLFNCRPSSIRVKCEFLLVEIERSNQSSSFKIQKWLNSKRTDGVPLIEVQVRKPIRGCSRKWSDARTYSSLDSESNFEAATFDARSAGLDDDCAIHPGAWQEDSIERSLYGAFILFCLEFGYTVYILTEDFRTDLSQPGIFIDLVSDEKTATNYMRLKSDASDEQTANESLQDNVLGKFKAHGPRVDQVNSISSLTISWSNDLLFARSTLFVFWSVGHNRSAYFENADFLCLAQVHQMKWRVGYHDSFWFKSITTSSYSSRSDTLVCSCSTRKDPLQLGLKILAGLTTLEGMIIKLSRWAQVRRRSIRPPAVRTIKYKHHRIHSSMSRQRHQIQTIHSSNVSWKRSRGITQRRPARQWSTSEVEPPSIEKKDLRRSDRLFKRLLLG